MWSPSLRVGLAAKVAATVDLVVKVESAVKVESVVNVVTENVANVRTVASAAISSRAASRLPLPKPMITKSPWTSSTSC